MKKLLSMVILVAHTTSFAVDQTRIQINAQGSEASKVVIGADALQLQHAQWQHDDQQAAKAKQESNEHLAKRVETTNAQFHTAVVTGDASKVKWALSPADDMATNINTPINGFNALPLQVALDQLIKTADTYNHPTANRVMKVANEAGNVTGFVSTLAYLEYLGLAAISGGLSALAYAQPKWNKHFGLDLTANNFYTAADYCAIATVACAAATIALKAPKFFHTLYHGAAESYENMGDAYWNKLENRFALARTILNCNKVDLNAPEFNTPQAQRALEFIRTNDETVTTYKQFVADVKAGKYESLRLCNQA